MLNSGAYITLTRYRITADCEWSFVYAYWAGQISIQGINQHLLLEVALTWLACSITPLHLTCISYAACQHDLTPDSYTIMIHLKIPSLTLQIEIATFEPCPVLAQTPHLAKLESCHEPAGADPSLLPRCDWAHHGDSSLHGGGMRNKMPT